MQCEIQQVTVTAWTLLDGGGADRIAGGAVAQKRIETRICEEHPKPSALQQRQRLFNPGDDGGAAVPEAGEKLFLTSRFKPGERLLDTALHCR